MGRERGWVSVSVRTYQSHRSQQSQPQNQRVMQQDYTVDESGATLNAVSRSSDVREEEEGIKCKHEVPDQRARQRACTLVHNRKLNRPNLFAGYLRTQWTAERRTRAGALSHLPRHKQASADSRSNAASMIQ